LSERIENPIVRDTRDADLSWILDIYADAVVNLNSTFDIEPPTLDERRLWFRDHNHMHPVISAEVAGRVVGYCSISPFSRKQGYSPTVELSVYVHKDYRRKGIGGALVKEIIARAKTLGYHAIISIITENNQASVELHKKFGFRRVAHLYEVGYKFSEWQNVDYYELLL
jgi:phosphinothricin acetyltransferase